MEEALFNKPGTYTIKVEAYDSSFNFNDSNPFNLEVLEQLEPLAINCCNGKLLVDANVKNTWQPTIKGGVTPYEVSIDLF